MLTSNCTACILELSSFTSINSSVKGELGLREICTVKRSDSFITPPPTLFAGCILSQISKAFHIIK